MTSRPSPRGVWPFVVLALPALLYYPARTIQSVAPPLSGMRSLSQMLVMTAFLGPLWLLWMLALWRDYHPSSQGARWTVVALIAWTAFMALQAVPMLSLLLGIV